LPLLIGKAFATILPHKWPGRVTQVRKSVMIDWTLREGARAKIKVLVKRIVRKHGYPPDLQDEATKLVLQQAELLCAEWAA